MQLRRGLAYCLNPACLHPQNPDVSYCLSCGSPLLLQRYRTLKLIGQGGFGRTFLAIDESDPSKPCAVKQFFPHQGTNNHRASVLFHQEALQLAALGEHPQIPKLLAYCEQDGQQYLVQEFIEGQNLAQELAEAGAFTESEIWQLLSDLLPVLQLVHEHQIVHRDIKPANVIRRSSDGQLVLVDFGAAKSSTDSLAQTGTMIGSAEYAAPEQTRGKAVFASDLYSLGVTCIHLLTQIPPFDLFDSSEDGWVWRNYLSFPVSESLGQILDKLLQNALKRRYQSAAEVLQDLNSPPPQTTQLSGIETDITLERSPEATLAKTIDLSVAATGLSATIFDPQTQSWRHTPNPFEHSEAVWTVAPFLRPCPATSASTPRQVMPQVASTTVTPKKRRRPWRFLTAVGVAAVASLAIKIRRPLAFLSPATEKLARFLARCQHR